MNRTQKSEHFCSSHFGCFHRAGARPANYCSKPIINVRDRSISINATDCSGTFCSFDFADEENCVFIKGRAVRIGWGAPLGSTERGILYGEDESGPCAGDERTGQGSQSCPIVQRGQQRIMGRERRVWSRPLGPQRQAKISKCHWSFINVSVFVSCF